MVKCYCYIFYIFGLVNPRLSALQTNQKMIKLVAFDWNGTLFADANTVNESANHFIRKLGGKPVSLSFYRKHFQIPVIDYYTKVGLDRDHILKNSKTRSQIFHDHYEQKALKLRTRQNAKTLLQFLKESSIESIILSNHTVKGINIQLKRLKIEHYFSKVLANDEVDSALKGLSKGDRLVEYFQEDQILAKNGLIIGDTAEETEIGKSLNMVTVSITHGHSTTSRLKAAKPDFIISDLKQVIPIIKSLRKP